MDGHTICMGNDHITYLVASVSYTYLVLVFFDYAANIISAQETQSWHCCQKKILVSVLDTV